MNIINLAGKPPYWLDREEFPDEWERMWAALADLHENRGDRACEYLLIGERWQYMGTQWEDNGWMHCFRHRHHPTTQKLEYRLIPSAGLVEEGGDRHD